MPSKLSPRARSWLIGAAFLLAAVWLADAMGQWVLNYSIPQLGMRVAAFCGIGVLLAIMGRWRFGVFLFLVWLTFEDLLRKYLGNNMTIYFVKDLLVTAVYAAYLFFVMKRRERMFRPPILVPLLAFLLLALVQSFNPRSTSFLYGLLAVQMDFYFIPLIFIGYALLSSLDDVESFLGLNFTVACVVAGIGIIQASGYRDFLNPAVLAPQLRYLGHLTRYVPGMSHALSAPPSVFVSQGRYANYLELMFTLALGTAAFQIFRRRSARWAYLTLGILGVAIFLSGSKGALVYSLITVVGFGVALLWGVRGQPWVSARLGKLMRRSVIALAAGGCLLVAIYPNLTQSWGTYYYDLLWPDSPTSELGYRIGNYPLANFEKALDYPHWLTGYGTGTASLGIEYVTGSFHAPDPPVGPVENGYGSLLIEMGILGPILWAILGAAIVISGWKITRRLASTPLYPLGLCIVWFAFWVLFPFTWGSMSTYQNFVVNAYLWLLVGILYRLPSLIEAAPAREAALPVVTARPAEPVAVGHAT